MKVLVTGSAGFIGFHVVKALLSDGHDVVGYDSVNDYYDVSLKKARLNELECFADKCGPEYKFYCADLVDKKSIDKCFYENKFSHVIHLAAQAGVRYSIENPQSYIQSNIVGFLNILEACRYAKIKHLVYASSSSVYGLNAKQPFSICDRVDDPVSLYAATKIADELMAKTYSHLYKIPCTGLRFFTVYGPWGRPDMAYFSFTEKILKGEAINIYNNGDMERDFTYIDDVVDGILGAAYAIPASAEVGDDAPKHIHKLYNIGNNKPVSIGVFLSHIERLCNKKAVVNYLPMQPGDVKSTYADISSTQSDLGFVPKTALDKGLDKFVQWYKLFYMGSSE